MRLDTGVDRAGFILLWMVSLLSAAPAGRSAERDADADPEAPVSDSVSGPEDRPLTAGARAAREEYDRRAPGIALRIDRAAAASRENAALLYCQALLARREPDPLTAQALNEASRGGPPGVWVKVYLGRSLRTIEIAHVAAQMPRCTWGPMRVAEQQLDFNLGLPLRGLGRILDADARTLAADGHHRAALARCLTIRRLARHTDDGTYNLYSISQSIHTLALLATAHVLSLRPSDTETLRWLKDQLAAVPGTPFEPARALHQWRDAELQFWRTRPRGRAFTRARVLDKTADPDDRKLLATLTDEQLLVLALLGEQKVPGLYGGLFAPPALLERAQRACDEYLQSALEIMKADLPYLQRRSRLQEMVDSLDLRAADGDPIALLSEAPKVVELYHRLMVRNSVYDNLLAAALEICLQQARTGELPQTLAGGLPKDLYTGRNFEYEPTDTGFALRFDPDNISRIRVRRLEFRTRARGVENP